MARKKKQKSREMETYLICDICRRKTNLLIPKPDEPEKLCCQECLKLTGKKAA